MIRIEVKLEHIPLIQEKYQHVLLLAIEEAFQEVNVNYINNWHMHPIIISIIDKAKESSRYTRSGIFH
jgi:hypothetical protein